VLKSAYHLSVNALLTIFATGAATIAFAQGSGAPTGFENCKVLSDDKARLDCFKQLLTGGTPAESKTPDASPYDAWRLVRTADPRGGPDAVSIMRTADTGRSDPDLAGLMIRCQEKQGLGVLLGVVRPFPPRSKRNVAIGSGGVQSVFVAESTDTGTALVLPIDASAFTTGVWRSLNRLEVKISDPEADIHGMILLDGVTPAIAKLAASCPPR